MDGPNWVDIEHPDETSGFCVVNDSLLSFDLAFDDFVSFGNHLSDFEAESAFERIAASSSSPEEDAFLPSGPIQVSRFPSQPSCSFWSPSDTRDFESFADYLCSSPADFIWDQTMTGFMPNDPSQRCLPPKSPVLPDIQMTGLSAFPSIDSELHARSPLGQDFQSIPPDLRTPSNSYDGPVNTNLADLLKLPPASSEFGSPPSQQTNQADEDGELLKGNRCLWAACQWEFGNVAQLRSHLRDHTVNQKVCLWEGCAKVEISTGNLNKHLDLHIKPYRCTHNGCNARATTTRDLRRHLQSHGRRTGTLVFYCPFEDCKHSQKGKKPPFGRLDNATRHLKRRHPGFTTKPVPGTVKRNETISR